MCSSRAGGITQLALCVTLYGPTLSADSQQWAMCQRQLEAEMTIAQDENLHAISAFQVLHEVSNLAESLNLDLD